MRLQTFRASMSPCSVCQLGSLSYLCVNVAQVPSVACTGLYAIPHSTSVALGTWMHALRPSCHYVHWKERGGPPPGHPLGQCIRCAEFDSAHRLHCPGSIFLTLLVTNGIPDDFGQTSLLSPYPVLTLLFEICWVNLVCELSSQGSIPVTMTVFTWPTNKFKNPSTLLLM
jgi:hypothetical protein